ncbi:MAG: hypothetical protein JWQ20_2670 [Conexibacter sp.]|nr:hypothetical protein [Conexibacter sp.]
MPTEAEIAVVVAALDDAAEVVAYWHGRRTEEGFRLADLAEAIETLRAVRGPFTAYCSTLPHTNYADDEIRRLNVKVGVMIDRLRSMQSPTSGRPTPRRPARNAKSLRTTLTNARSELDVIDDEHQAIRRGLAMGAMATMPNGGRVLSVSELNAEARELLDRIDALRYRLRTAWNAYQRGHDDRVVAETDAGRSGHAPADERDRYFLPIVTELRARAKTLRVAVALSASQREPSPEVVRRPFERWTLDDVALAWVAFHVDHARWPTKRDHNESDELPGYTQVRRIAGDGPFPVVLARAEQMLDSVTIVTSS